MNKNPITNAFLAAAYIAGIVLLINSLSSIESAVDGPGIIVLPMLALSLFVFSAAFMGYLFVYEPICLYLDGKKEEAKSFFAKTLLTFGAILIVAAILVLILII